jgi:hypothetical protein
MMPLEVVISTQIAHNEAQYLSHLSMLYFSGVDTNIIQIAAFELNIGCTFESYVFPPT